MKPKLCLGLDIGTTTISAVVLDEHRKPVASRTVKSEAFLPSDDPDEKIQDVRVIEEKALKLVHSLLSNYPGIDSIGVTGQMHGILYLDVGGTPLSPLFTWQDQRSAPFCSHLTDITGYPIAPGYGLATHYALLQAGQVPVGTAMVCTIMDYLAFVLCGRQKLTIHSSNAAALGFFDLKRMCFDETALEKAGIDPGILPPVTCETALLGQHGQIRVSVAIGDNQASFLGSVTDPETTALANFGTGSQISVLTRDPVAPDPAIEIRPYLGNTYLACGCALCGGRAYALLEQFFRIYAVSCGLAAEEQFQVLNALAEEGMALADPMQVKTTFSGTRSNASLRGSIQGISDGNFTPASLTAGVLLGMAGELHEMYTSIPGTHTAHLVASGNAARKNPALICALGRVFGMDVQLPEHQEEAAFGAAIFGSLAAKKAPC